jgi:beta-glucanase (GH16 family)
VASWSDSFNGPQSLADWSITSGGNGWGSKELQDYTSANVSLMPGGGLVITADRSNSDLPCWNGTCQYTSGRLETQGLFQQEYGIFEAYIKVPTGRGLWPAFWMEGVESPMLRWPYGGEIDVIEVNNKQPGMVEGFAHGPDTSYGAYLQLHEPLSNGYHAYAIDWTPTEITWLVDGHVYGHVKIGKDSSYHQPFFLILDLAVGGEWPGSPTTNTVFPTQMDVAWVHVYKRA